MEQNQLENSQVVLNTHDSGKCLGEYCTIHNRSDHSMRSFPQHWRDDKGIMERICLHGIGHPDPDEVYMVGSWDWAHACDGCCLEKNTSIENTIVDDTIINDSKYKRSPIGTIYNHEPECLPIMTKIYDINDPCPLCTMVRKAYKRGREDAAKAIEDLAASHGDSDWALTVHAASIAHGIELALIAARGGEQE